MDILLAFTPNGASASPSVSASQKVTADPSPKNGQSFAEQLDAVTSSSIPSDTASETPSEGKHDHRDSTDNPQAPQHTDPQHSLVPDTHYPALPADASTVPPVYTGLVVSGLAAISAETFSREPLLNESITHEPISNETLSNERLMSPGQDARLLDQTGERLAQMVEARQERHGAATSLHAFPASADSPLARSLSSSPENVVPAPSSNPAALALTGREQPTRHQTANDRQQQAMEAVERNRPAGPGPVSPAHVDTRMPAALPDKMSTDYAGGLENKEAASAAPSLHAHDSGLLPAGSSMASSSTRLPGASGPGAFQASIALPVNSPAWPEQLSSTLARFSQTRSTAEGDHRIELRLHPAELGPLSINLRLGEHGAQAQFFSAHPQVRHAVEQAIPQLREALAEQGIQLGDTSVGSQGFARPQDEASHSSTSARTSETEDLQITAVSEVAQGASTRTSRMDGRIDLYA